MRTCMRVCVCVMYICVSYNTGKSALPDIYALTLGHVYIRMTPKGAQRPRASAYISGNARVPVL